MQLATLSRHTLMYLTMENHRQCRITRKDIAEFLETETKYYLFYNSVIYFHLCLEVWNKNGVNIQTDNKIRVAEMIYPLTNMPRLVYCFAKSDVQIKCASYLFSKHLIMTIFALL